MLRSFRRAPHKKSSLLRSFRRRRRGRVSSNIVCDANSLEVPSPNQALVFPLVQDVPLEDYVRGVGCVVGPANVLFASRVSESRVCVYLSTEQLAVNFVREKKGLVVRHTFLPVRRLYDQPRRLLIWNASPSVPHDLIEEELRCAGLELTSALHFQPAHLNEFGYDHVYAFRREVYVRFHDDQRLPDSIFVPFDGGYHKVYIGSDEQFCRRCRTAGHSKRRCSEMRRFFDATSASSYASDEDVNSLVLSMFRTVQQIDSTEVEELYTELIFECLHLVGQDATSGIKKDILFSYLKNVFQINDTQHSSFLNDAKSREPPQVLLKVEVLEAKDLTPKDANGLSDPFCVLWISSKQTDRFTSSVKTQTLNPAWEESFQLNIASTTQDVLHLDVWDFDAAESIKDKMVKINEVKTSFWAIKKYLKELTQTAYKGNHDNELIGSAHISLKNIPSTGQMAWFDLQRKKRKQGMILLKMMFGSEKDPVVALVEHRHLIRAVVLHHLSQENFDSAEWLGDLPDPCQIILRQHLAQSNLGYTEDLLARWIEYVNIHQSKPLNFILLANVLNDVEQRVRNGLFTEDEKKMFWESARKILPSCFNFIRRINKSVRKDIVEKLQAIVSIIKNLSTCNPPPSFDLFPSDVYGWLATVENLTIKDVLHEAVVNGACDWFNYLLKRHKTSDNSDNCKLQEKVKMVEFIDIDLEHSLRYNEQVFNKLMQFPYTRTLFTVYQRLVSEMAEPIVVDMCLMMKPLDFEKQNEANNDPLSTGTSMFELYLKLQKLNGIGNSLFGDDYNSESFKITEFYDWFFPGVARWLDIAAYKALQRIEKAVELDEFIPVDRAVQYSSSAVDTMSIYFQIKVFWDQLEWPNIEGSYTFIARIIDDICKCSVFYADTIGAKVERMDDFVAPNSIKYEVTNEWCIAINNIDYVHRSIRPFVSQLGLDKVLSSLADFKSEETAEHCRNTLELVMNNTVENVGNKIDDLLDTVAGKMVPSMSMFLQEGAELLHQQSDVLDKLMLYLDRSLIQLNSKLNPENFTRILNLIWEKLSVVLYDLVKNGIEKHRPPSFFSNLSHTMRTLIGFFKLDNEEDIKKNDTLCKVQRILDLYGMETADLIHHYHCERYKSQKTLEKTKDGIMAVQVNKNNDTLEVTILNAQNIRPMDSNGYCDPFVSLRLLPKHKYPHTKHKTKVQKKTLFPLFDEKFTLHLTPEQQQLRNTLIMFVMKDQDFYGAKNDYVAECFVCLDELPPDNKQIHLKLHRPFTIDEEILKALDYRHGDKQARDFVKREKSRMNDP